jgi:ribosomal protein L29
MDDRRTQALNGYRKRLLEHRELEEKLKQSKKEYFLLKVNYKSSSWH